MHKIKNDPTNYVKRANLGPKGKVGEPLRVSEKRRKAFLAATIDQAGYIDFSIEHSTKPDRQR